MLLPVIVRAAAPVAMWRSVGNVPPAPMKVLDVAEVSVMSMIAVPGVMVSPPRLEMFSTLPVPRRLTTFDPKPIPRVLVPALRLSAAVDTLLAAKRIVPSCTANVPDVPVLTVRSSCSV